MSIPAETIIPEIDDIVNFYKPKSIEQIAKDKGFAQRESALGGMEFLAIMTYGLFSQPDGSNAKRHQSLTEDNCIRTAPKDKSISS